MENAEQKWESFLNPDILKKNLVSASLYIAAFESLKNSIIDNLQCFYCIEIYEKNELCKEYRKKILARNKSAVYASLDWFKENGAIEQKDIEKFNQIKNLRNDLSHLSI